MRSVLLRLHRYVGLIIAGFLIIAGLSGAILSWDRELDAWINRDLFVLERSGAPRSPHELAALIEAREPRGRVTFIPLHLEPGGNEPFTVRPRLDPRTGEPFVLDYTQVFVDPVTGRELARRDGDGTSLSWRSLMPFLIKLHYSLHLPLMGGHDLGLWLMGLVALAWTLNSLAAIALTFPPRRSGSGWWRRWRPAWGIRWRSGGPALSFDLHRAGALWLWPALLLVAFTGFTQNLHAELFEPVVSTFSTKSPTPYEGRTPTPLPGDAPLLASAQIAHRAGAEARRLGWREPAHNMSYSPEANLYAVYFLRPEDDRGGADISVKTLYLDGDDGRILGLRSPLSGTAADVFEKMQFPVHSGRLLGVPGQIFMSFFGLMVATLATTGILIWARKRRSAQKGRAARARRLERARAGSAS